MIEQYKSINPFDGREIASHASDTPSQVDQVLEASQRAFRNWRRTPSPHRAALLRNAGGVLRRNVERYARMITLEMGKPIEEARREVGKCAFVCDHYAEHAGSYLADQPIETEASRSFVRHDPIGPILGIMPWNFPFWQVFRFAAPTLAAGNTVVLKHASNVFGCAERITQVFDDAGFPTGVFHSLVVGHEAVESVIAHDTIRAVTLTGSERAGAAVASLAGKYLKKTVLELGGSNAFIVWNDANVDEAVDTAIAARMLNAGQSCIAAKRFILLPRVYEAFVAKFVERAANLRRGDPLDEATQIGPLARPDLADVLQRQVTQAVNHGATLRLGGRRDDGAFHEPTVLTDVIPGTAVLDDETFGPVAVMLAAADEDHAFELAQRSRYGLGVTVFTADVCHLAAPRHRATGVNSVAMARLSSSIARRYTLGSKVATALT